MMEHGQLGHFARAELGDSVGAFEAGHRPWGGVVCPGYWSSSEDVCVAGAEESEWGGAGKVAEGWGQTV